MQVASRGLGMETYGGNGNRRQGKRVANDVPDAHAFAAILSPRVFHFPERRGAQRSVVGHVSGGLAAEGWRQSDVRLRGGDSNGAGVARALGTAGLFSSK